MFLAGLLDVQSKGEFYVVCFIQKSIHPIIHFNGCWRFYLLEKPTITVTHQSYIISANDFTKLNEKLDEYGIQPSHLLPIINAVAVDLTEVELSDFEKESSFNITPNHQVKLMIHGWGRVQRRFQPSAVIVDYVGASSAHYNYNFGDDVTIGFLDTGLDQLEGLSTDLYGGTRHGGIMMRLIIVYIIMMMRLMGMVHM